MHFFNILHLYWVFIIIFVGIVGFIVGEKLYIQWKKKQYNPNMKNGFFIKKGKYKYYDEAFFGGGKYLETLHDNDIFMRISQERIEKILQKADLKTQEAREKQIQKMSEAGELFEAEREIFFVILKRIFEYAIHCKMLMRHYAEQEKPFLSSALHESLLLFEGGKIKESAEKIKEGIEISKKEKNCGAQEESELWEKIGEGYMLFCMFTKGEESYKKAVEIWEKEKGERNERSIFLRNKVAYSLLMQKKAAEAFTESYRVLSTAIQIFGKNSYQATNCFAAVGNCLFENEEIMKAHDYWEQTLSLSINIYGENHPATAACYTNLGRIYIREKELIDKGIFYISEGIRQDIRYFGKNHERIFVQYNILAMPLFEHRELAKSVKYFKQTYEIAKKVYGGSHSFLVATLNNIGGVLFFLKKYDESIKYYHKSLHMNGRILGEQHREIAVVHDNLGRSWRAKKDCEKAKFHYQKALEIFQTLPPEEQDGILAVKKNLCEIFHKMGDKEKAQKYACEIVTA